jgi:hypothetical protein
MSTLRGYVRAQSWTQSGLNVLLPGIAFRMLYDLGLNRDGTDLLALGYISERDLQVRHDVFWGCYVYDKYVDCRWAKTGYLMLHSGSTAYT